MLKDEGEVTTMMVRYTAKGGQLFLPVAEGGHWQLENFQAVSVLRRLKPQSRDSDVLPYRLLPVLPNHRFNTWDLVEAVWNEITLHSQPWVRHQHRRETLNKELETLTYPLNFDWNALRVFEISWSLQYVAWTISPDGVVSVPSDDVTRRCPEYWCGRWYVIHCNALSATSYSCCRIHMILKILWLHAMTSSL